MKHKQCYTRTHPQRPKRPTGGSAHRVYPAQIPDVPTKLCGLCEQELPLDHFTAHIHGKYGYDTVCRKCQHGRREQARTVGYCIMCRVYPAVSGRPACRRCIRTRAERKQERLATGVCVECASPTAPVST